MEMITNKKAVITVIEMSLLILLFSSAIVYLVSNPSFQYTNYESVDSVLDAILESNNYSEIFILEDLTSIPLTQDWTSIKLLLNSSFNEYEIIVSNMSDSKKIISCNPKYSKTISQRIVPIYNNTVYEFRIISLGVCF
jgi:hypothetical protein